VCGSDMQLIKPDTLEDLTSALNDLLADEVVCITADDFTKLTGDDLNFPVTEGRFLIGNLSARANCAVLTTHERVVFTKNPALDIPQRTSEARRILTS
jgi:hypothetical protein